MKIKKIPRWGKLSPMDYVPIAYRLNGRVQYQEEMDAVTIWLSTFDDCPVVDRYSIRRRVVLSLEADRRYERTGS